MVPSTRARTLLACLSVLAAPIAAAQLTCLDIAPVSMPDFVTSEEPPTDVLEFRPGRFHAQSNTSIEFFDGVSLRYHGGLLTSERMNVDESTVDITGRVTFANEDFTVFAEGAELDNDTREITIDAAGFNMPKRPARGSAEQILITDSRTLSLRTLNFTTCPEDDPDWLLIARDLKLDAEAGFGTAHGVKLKFKGVPILYTPYFTFPIDDRRKSGFLTPQIADRDRTDLARGGEIRLQQRRGAALSIGDVVEPERRDVRRQQRRDVDVECEQIADGVGILGAVQSTQDRPSR